MYLCNIKCKTICFYRYILIENITNKKVNGVGRPCEYREDETEKFNVFIQEMVQVVEKYGNQVLQDLGCVA